MTYTGPRLEDLQDLFGVQCADILGDSLTYTAPGGSPMPIRGYVDFGDQVQDLETGKIIAQDIMVEVPIAVVPTRPTGLARITISAIPDATFKPVNVARSDDGHHWRFNVEKVNG